MQTKHFNIYSPSNLAHHERLYFSEASELRESARFQARWRINLWIREERISFTVPLFGRRRLDITSFLPSFFFACLWIFILQRIPAIKRAPKSTRSARNWKDPPSCRASARCRIYRPMGIRIAMEQTESPSSFLLVLYGSSLHTRIIHSLFYARMHFCSQHFIL